MAVAVTVRVLDTQNDVIHEHHGPGGSSLVEYALDPEAVLTRLRAFNDQAGPHNLLTCERCRKAALLRAWREKAFADAGKSLGDELARGFVEERKVDLQALKEMRADYLLIDPKEVDDTIQRTFVERVKRLQQGAMSCDERALSTLLRSLRAEEKRFSEIRDNEALPAAARSQGKANALAYSYAADIVLARLHANKGYTFGG